MSRSEHQEQVDLFSRVLAFHPDALLFAVPNGGLRNPRVAARLKAEGVKAGAPDLLLAEPRGPYVGMAIEMKRVGFGKLRRNQKDFLDRLAARGWCVVVADRGVDYAFARVESYLAMPPSRAVPDLSDLAPAMM